MKQLDPQDRKGPAATGREPGYHQIPEQKRTITIREHAAAAMSLPWSIFVLVLAISIMGFCAWAVWK